MPIVGRRLLTFLAMASLMATLMMVTRYNLNAEEADHLSLRKQMSIQHSILLAQQQLVANGKESSPLPTSSPTSARQTSPRTVQSEEDHTIAAEFSNEVGNELDMLDSLSSAPVKTAATKVIYVITPTYTRPTQMADMTRLAQTLMLVKDVFWIVVEDANEFNVQVSDLLNRTGIPYVHLLGPRPITHRDKRSGRGVSNRLRAFQWLRDQFTNTTAAGVIYLADDDNAYDIRIFEEMRTTEKVSVFPVGTIAKLGVSSPVIDPKTGLVVGFHDPFLTRRKFAVDMAGFAVDLQLFLSRPKATMPYKVGYEEDYFIKSLGIKISDLEPKADNCTKVLVWHVKTQPSVFPSLQTLAKEKKYSDTNLPILYRNVEQTIA